MTATPQLMFNRKWYKASKLEMEFHKINIIYAALSIRARIEKTTFSCKDDCTLTKHTGRWTYYARDFEIPLCHIPPLRSFLLIEGLLESKNGGLWQSGISKSLAVCPAPCVLRQCTVVLAWKCRLFCLCAYGQCRVYYISHVEFHFRFGCLVLFPV